MHSASIRSEGAEKVWLSEQKHYGQLVAEIQTSAYLIGFFYSFNIHVLRLLNTFMISFTIWIGLAMLKIYKHLLMDGIPTDSVCLRNIPPKNINVNLTH